ncbi:MAG TPA: 3-phosphoshikimate 1-carboxyvinyltransferase [Gemmatimonadaceae bacterium]|nr:3-phosphoshikimate 1-carboxyvinyltransferase [Gemmatimonadaceae bacterium]
MKLKVAGTIRVPGDKSISHRALMLAALGDGRSRITGVLDSADVQSTAGVLRALGVPVPPLTADFSIDGVGRAGLKPPASPLDCGNSGTSARLLAGIVAAQPFTSTFIGDASLSRRPMRRVAKPLTEMGATVTLPDHGGLPMTIRGGDLRPVHYFSETSSAQVKSAVLLAGAAAGVPVSVTEPMRSRDHTERMLEARGAHVHLEEMRDGHCVHLGRIDRISALDVRVPGDPSSAAFFAGLAALATSGEIVMPWVCVNQTRDGAFAVLERMGAKIRRADQVESGGEHCATVVVSPGRLTATTIGGAEVPALIDELPLLACVAARAEGETVITGAHELRVKESDRITAVVTNLRAIGVEASELPDGLRVTGSARRLSGRVESHGDHRIAMAFGILGAIPGNAIEIDDPACVAVSYPAFWSDLASAVSR